MLHPKQQFIKDIYGKTPETLNEIAEACIAVISTQTETPVVGFAWKIEYMRKVRQSSHSTPIGQNRQDCKSYAGFYGRVWVRHAAHPGYMDTCENLEKALTYTGSGGTGAYDGIWRSISAASFKTRKRVDAPERVHGFKFKYVYPEPRCQSYDYRFALSDFPGIYEEVTKEVTAFEEEQDRQETWHAVQSKYYRREQFVLKHQFQWEDPAVKAADQAFLETYVTDYLKKELA